MSETMSYREVFNKYYRTLYPDSSFDTFSRAVRRWKSKNIQDFKILDSANLAGNFYAHDATVQVDGEGNIVQAWIKQTQRLENQIDRIVDCIKQDVKPIECIHKPVSSEERMLEIPLFDMHFGVSDIEYYSTTLNGVCDIINSRVWSEINIIIGQDLLHNDGFEGRTTKGTAIEKVNIEAAWKDAYKFYFNLIKCALINSVKVNVKYSKGNHDKSISWAFVQLLKSVFEFVDFDDSMDARKCIYWNGCFIGVTHGQYSKSSPNDLFRQFVIEFPEQFANSSVREIHAGHLHREGYSDLGIMVRRLSTYSKTDDWSSDNGFVCAHKRFMLFEYEPNKLKAIHYV